MKWLLNFWNCIYVVTKSEKGFLSQKRKWKTIYKLSQPAFSVCRDLQVQQMNNQEIKKK